VVGIRTAGMPHFIDVRMKRAFDTWQPVGPRVFAGGYFLTTTAGHALATEFAKVCDGPSGFVKAIREQIQHGVDQIKLVTTGGIMGGGHDVMSAVMFLREELEAAVRIAHQRGVPVAVHATYHEAVKWAVRAGAHSIEHGYVLDEEAVSLMAQRAIYYVPSWPSAISPPTRRARPTSSVIVRSMSCRMATASVLTAMLLATKTPFAWPWRLG
jgi:imidazolonepropionase-like amidohydrolase